MQFDEAYVWARVDKSGGPHACWPWTGLISKIHGMGVVCKDSKHYWAPRYIYEMLHGRRVGRGFRVFHTCNNRLCCNPEHFEVHKNGWWSPLFRSYLLTPKQVTYISHLWCGGAMNTKEMTKKFGVCRSTIYDALHGDRRIGIDRCHKRRPHNFRKINAGIVLEIRRRRAQGELLQDLAEEYGVSQGHISRIARKLSLTKVKDDDDPLPSGQE